MASDSRLTSLPCLSRPGIAVFLQVGQALSVSKLELALDLILEGLAERQYVLNPVEQFESTPAWLALGITSEYDHPGGRPRMQQTVAKFEYRPSSVISGRDFCHHVIVGGKGGKFPARVAACCKK